MNFSNRRVLVAGGSGFLGTNLALRLAAEGARVRLTRHVKPLQANIPGAEIVDADLRRADDCARAVEGMDCVFLCAAHTSGAAAIRGTPLVHITPNVLINTLMLEAAHRAAVGKFCFVSSGAAYPLTGIRPVSEGEMFSGDPPDVYFPAGWMKRYAEILCRTYAEKIANPMPTVVVRPSNVYGPYDKFDPAVSHVTAALIRRVVEREAPLQVWGDGEDIRDLLYVDDFIDGLLAAAAVDRPFLAINICAGTGHSIKQILQTMLQADGYSGADVRYDASKPTTIRHRPMDNRLAQELLGFAPKVPLDEGLRRTISWFRTARETS